MKINNFKNIFLDRDGIVNNIIMRDGVVSSPRTFEEFKFRDDFLEFAKKIDISLNFFLVTNQPDVSRNLLKLEDLNLMHNKLNNILPFKEILVCTHDDSDNCNCRKPKPGMLLKAINENKLQHNNCLMIGDSSKDIDAAISAGIDAYLLDTYYNKGLNYKHKIQSLLSLLD